MKTTIIDGVVLTPIPSYKGFSDYLVDTINGRVYSLKSKRFLTMEPNLNGYVYNTLISDDGKAYSYGVHRIVMASYTGIFLEEFRRGKIEIDHINEDLKHVNGIHNLQMSDRKGQYRESTRAKMGKGKRLKEEQVCEILEAMQEYMSDEESKISTFMHQTAEAYGVTYRCIFNLVNGKSWKRFHEEMAS